MKRMNKHELKKLENIQKNIQITLYLPLMPGPENTAKNTSMLHHVLALVRKTYTNSDIPKAEQHLTQEHIIKLEQELTHPQSAKSLAIFICNTNEMYVYGLPFAVEAAMYFMVPHLQLEPLFMQYRTEAPYWVLSLSQKGCALFKGMGDTLQQVTAKDISLDLRSMLCLDEINVPDIQSHSVGTGSEHINEGFHGHGGFRDLKKKYLEQYLRIIDKKLHRYIPSDSGPLYVVGVDYSKALFKRISNRKNIIVSDTSIDSNKISIDALRRVVEPLFKDLVTA